VITTLPKTLRRDVFFGDTVRRCEYNHVVVDEENELLFNNVDFAMSYLLRRECGPQFSYFTTDNVYVDESHRYRCLEIEMHCAARLFVFDENELIIAIYHRE